MVVRPPRLLHRRPGHEGPARAHVLRHDPRAVSLRRRGYRDGQREADDRRLSWGALDPDAPSLGLDEPLRDVEPEAGARPARRAAHLGPLEPLEQVRELARLDAVALVGDG